MRKYKGVTLVELIVSVLILALIMAGLANIFYTSRRYIVLNRSRIQAVEFSKTVLENLSSFVRQDSWNNPANDLCINTSAGCLPNNRNDYGTSSFNYVTYNTSYNVSNVTNAPEIRKVKIKVNWTEPVN